MSLTELAQLLNNSRVTYLEFQNRNTFLWILIHFGELSSTPTDIIYNPTAKAQMWTDHHSHTEYDIMPITLLLAFYRLAVSIIKVNCYLYAGPEGAARTLGGSQISI